MWVWRGFTSSSESNPWLKWGWSGPGPAKLEASSRLEISLPLLHLSNKCLTTNQNAISGMIFFKSPYWQNVCWTVLSHENKSFKKYGNLTNFKKTIFQKYILGFQIPVKYPSGIEKEIQPHPTGSIQSHVLSISGI